MTIARLLFRFFDVEGGSVSVGGLDVRSVTQASLRRLMGVVPQDTVLFNSSLDYNIDMASATALREERDDAAKTCISQCFRESIGGGLGHRRRRARSETERRGKTKSGHRALVREEPSDRAVGRSDLGSGFEDRGGHPGALAALSSDRTSVTIAHISSTISTCDSIIVLNSGRITERGSHAELLATGGRVQGHVGRAGAIVGGRGGQGGTEAEPQ